MSDTCSHKLTLGSHSTLTIISLWPHLSGTLRNQDTQDDFYAATLSPLDTSILIAGDFNSKLGKKKSQTNPITVASGTRMAQCSLTFLKQACLLATPLFNTLHVTRRRGKVNTACDEQEHCTHLQHYRLCQISKSLVHSRAFAGTLLDSDHRLLIAQLDLSRL